MFEILKADHVLFSKHCVSDDKTFLCNEQKKVRIIYEIVLFEMLLNK